MLLRRENLKLLLDAGKIEKKINSLVEYAVLEDGIELLGDLKLTIPSDSTGKIVGYLGYEKLESLYKVAKTNLDIEVEDNTLTDKISGSRLEIKQECNAWNNTIKENKVENTVYFPLKRLLKDYKQLKLALSKDNNRPILKHISLQIINNNIIELASLDRYRLHVKKYTTTKEMDNLSCVIPRYMFDILEKIKTKQENVKFIIGDNNIILEVGKIKVCMQAINGEYLNYHSLLYKDREIYPIDKKVIDNLKDYCKRVKGINKDDRNNTMKLNFRTNGLTLETKGEIEITENIDYQLEKELTIAFNSKYLLDALQGIEEEATISYINDTNPVIFEDRRSVSLVFPIRLS